MRQTSQTKYDDLEVMLDLDISLVVPPPNSSYIRRSDIQTSYTVKKTQIFQAASKRTVEILVTP